MYYWSCWFSYNELEAAGANVIVPAVFSTDFSIRRQSIIVIKDLKDLARNYMFTGESGLDSFLKIRHGYSTAVISEHLFNSVNKTIQEFYLDNATFGTERRNIWNCFVDF